MKLKISIFLILVIHSIFLGQNQKAQKYFNEGVNEFNLQHYVKADTLFTWSIREEPNKDAFYNRALCRLKEGKKEDFCMDLSRAAFFGDQTVENIFWTKCGKVDTTYLNKKFQLATKEDYEYLEIHYANLYGKREGYYIYNKKMKLRCDYTFIDSTRKVYYRTDNSAKFPGSSSDEYWFVAKNIKYPKEFSSYKSNYASQINFIVNEEGSLSDFTIIPQKQPCVACDQEALRIVKLSPKWKPAVFNEKPVSSFGLMHILFNSDKAK